MPSDIGSTQIGTNVVLLLIRLEQAITNKASSVLFVLGHGGYATYAEIKHSNWMFHVTWLLLTNQSALFQSSIVTLC